MVKSSAQGVHMHVASAAWVGVLGAAAHAVFALLL